MTKIRSRIVVVSLLALIVAMFSPAATFSASLDVEQNSDLAEPGSLEGIVQEALQRVYAAVEATQLSEEEQQELKLRLKEQLHKAIADGRNTSEFLANALYQLELVLVPVLSFGGEEDEYVIKLVELLIEEAAEASVEPAEVIAQVQQALQLGISLDLALDQLEDALEAAEEQAEREREAAEEQAEQERERAEKAAEEAEEQAEREREAAEES